MPKKTELSEEDKKLREKLGASVRRLTSAQGMKPQDVARIGGVSLAHQYRIENGETTPDGLYLFKVAACLGVSIDSFFGEEAASSGPSSKAAMGAMQGRSLGAVATQTQMGGGVSQVSTHAGSVQIGQAGGPVSIGHVVGISSRKRAR